MNKFVSKYLQFPLAFTLSFSYLVNSPALAMESIRTDENGKNEISTVGTNHQKKSVYGQIRPINMLKYRNKRYRHKSNFVDLTDAEKEKWTRLHAKSKLARKQNVKPQQAAKLTLSQKLTCEHGPRDHGQRILEPEQTIGTTLISVTTNDKNESRDDKLGQAKILERLKYSLSVLKYHSQREDDDYAICIIKSSNLGQEWKHLCAVLFHRLSDCMTKILGQNENPIELNKLRALENAAMKIVSSVLVTNLTAAEIINKWTEACRIKTPQIKNDLMYSRLTKIITHDGLPLLPDKKPTAYLQDYKDSASHYQWENMNPTESTEALRSLFLTYMLPVSIRSLEFQLTQLP